MPRLDRIGDGPERVALLPAELGVIAVELGRVLDIGSTDDVLAHARLRSRTVNGFSIAPEAVHRRRLQGARKSMQFRRRIAAGRPRRRSDPRAAHAGRLYWSPGNR